MDENQLISLIQSNELLDTLGWEWTRIDGGFRLGSYLIKCMPEEVCLSFRPGGQNRDMEDEMISGKNIDELLWCGYVCAEHDEYSRKYMRNMLKGRDAYFQGKTDDEILACLCVDYAEYFDINGITDGKIYISADPPGWKVGICIDGKAESLSGTPYFKYFGTAIACAYASIMKLQLFHNWYCAKNKDYKKLGMPEFNTVLRYWMLYTERPLS